jgi:hypothetical protein
VRVGTLAKRGGNYFTDSSNMIYTVTADGDLTIPSLPMNFILQNVTKTGTSYFLDLNGKFYSVTDQGEIYERVIQDMDMRNARVISL